VRLCFKVVVFADVLTAPAVATRTCSIACSSNQLYDDVHSTAGQASDCHTNSHSAGPLHRTVGDIREVNVDSEPWLKSAATPPRPGVRPLAASRSDRLSPSGTATESVRALFPLQIPTRFPRARTAGSSPRISTATALPASPSSWRVVPPGSGAILLGKGTALSLTPSCTPRGRRTSMARDTLSSPSLLRGHSRRRVHDTA
jgi:hypothetical protein